MGEDIVLIFECLMAGKTALEHRLTHEFSIVKLSVAPATGRRIFFGVFDHELNSVFGRSGDERLISSKRFVVFLRWDETPRDAGDNCALRKWTRPFAISADGNVIAQNGTYIVE